MSLRSRLAALKEESGSFVPSKPRPETALASEAAGSGGSGSPRGLECPAGPNGSIAPGPKVSRQSLTDALGRQLRVRGTQPVTCNPSPDAHALATRIDGEVVADGLIEVTARYEWPVTYGSKPISPGVQYDARTLLTGPRSTAAHAPRLVLLDTETTGLAGGTGTLPFLTGVVVCDESGMLLKQWLLTQFAGESAMLERLGETVQPGDMLATYNGKCFDVPLLLTRASLARQRLLLEAMPHLDLLYVVRRAFKGRWPDCRLQTAEQRLLGHTRVGDIPGEAIPEVWFDWMRRGSAGAMAAVVKHNHDDLIGLTALVSALARVYEQPEQHNACTLKVLEYAAPNRTVLVEELRERIAVLAPEERFELARLARQQGDWDTAVSHWASLSDAGFLPAREQLAKFHEHRARDFEVALALTRSLMEQEGRHPRHVHREQRLLRKQAQAR